MSDLSFQLGAILIGGALMLALLGLGVVAIMPGIDRWGKRFFVAYFMNLAVYAGFGLAEELIYIRPELRPAQAAIYYFETLLGSALMPMMTHYLLHCCGVGWRQSPLFRAVAVIFAVQFMTLNLSMTALAPWFYAMSPENQLTRGPLYLSLIVPVEAISILNLAGVIRWRRRLSKRRYFAFLVGLIPMVVSLFIHLFVAVFEFIAIAIVTSALAMFGIILSDQIGQDLRRQREIARQERELAHQRASIMVLQMRPHFIYNTMMSIYYLCKQDPDLAQRVTLDFTTYLRKNFTAIASEALIPFSEELEHARAYLAVEQAQFEDSLFVDYDTPHMDFCLPPLVLQPIVENAVKHGMDQDGEPLRILIRTGRTQRGSEIVVENNGTDFVPADDGGPHIALKNIRQRLEMMCRGALTIAPRKGGGIAVRVTIPDGVNGNGI